MTLSKNPSDVRSEILSYLKLRAVGILIVRGLSIIGAFLLFAAVAKAIAPLEFGNFSTGYAIATILSYVALFGQHVLILRFWPQIEAEEGQAAADGVMWRSFALAGLGIGAVVVLLGICRWVPLIVETLGGARNLLFVCALLALLSVAEMLASALRATGSFSWAFIPRDIAWRLGVICILYLFSIESLTGVYAVLCGTLFAVVTVQMIYLLIRGHLPRRSHRSGRSAEIAATNTSYWLSSSSAPILDFGATVAIGMALGPLSAGTYFAADRLAKVLVVGQVGFDQIVAPFIAKSIAQKRMDAVRLVVLAAGWLSLCLSASGGALYVVLGQDLLVQFGQAGTLAYVCLLVLTVGQVINTACGANVALMNMSGLQTELLYTRLFWGSVLIAGTVLLGKVVGIVGASCVAAATVIGWNITAVLVCRRKTNVDPFVLSPRNVKTTFSMLARLKR